MENCDGARKLVHYLNFINSEGVDNLSFYLIYSIISSCIVFDIIDYFHGSIVTTNKKLFNQ